MALNVHVVYGFNFSGNFIIVSKINFYFLRYVYSAMCTTCIINKIK